LNTVPNRAERFLVGLLITLCVVIAAVTVITLSARRAAPGNTANEAEQQRTFVFTGIGTLRAQLSGGATLIISVSFPYNGADRVFLEELAANVQKFRAQTLDYFAALTPNDPVLSDETALKQALLERYNALLHLGRIDTLYFTNFMLVD
jgi:flagellar basal body-associated protein FliL